tara:strand:+ start:1893 stop:3245 length:1353 start_codon:yes stop_codon:yes gene_type:complete
MNKIIFLKIILINVIIAQTSVKIYNQGWGLIQEERYKKFNKIEEQTLLITNLPKNIEPSSVILFSNEIEFISKQYIHNPISIRSMLNENINNNIELIKYNDEGIIIFSTIGKLISNYNKPIFEIDGNIVIDPPYEYRFTSIPKNINDDPYIKCLIKNISNDSKYNLSYLTSGINWIANYNIFLKSDEMIDLEGWYYIKNDNNKNYNKVDVSLVSGNINFLSNSSNQWKPNNKSMLRSASIINDNQVPEIENLENYKLYKIQKKITIPANNETQFKFLNKNNVPFNYVYHISHSYSRNYRTIPKEKIPVSVRMEISSADLGDFQIPKGKYSVYEKNNDELIFVGSALQNIISEDNILKLETGESHDILCEFILQKFQIDNKTTKIELEAIFQNKKNKPVNIKWIESFSDGNWEITNASHKYKQLDAYRIEFSINIPANSKQKNNLSAKIKY